MALLLDSWLTELVVVFCTATLALYLWFIHGFHYWKNRGVPYVQPTFPFGNFRQSILGQRAFWLVTQDLYKKLPGERVVGHFGFRRPILLIRDPDLVRQVLVKDFATFHDRGLFLDEDEPLNRHLLALSGYKWRQLRIKLSPTFSSGKLRGMFKTLQDCGHELGEVLEEVADRGETVEIRDMVARYTTDVIASIGFGIQCNCLRNPDAEFRQWGRKVLEPTLKTAAGNLLAFLSPTLGKILKIKTGTHDISEYFRRMVAETVAYREKNNVSRKDFMDLLIQLKNKGFVDGEKSETEESEVKSGFANDKLSLDDVAAQAFIFFGAGFETSSSTMSFALHELAMNQDVQKNLHSEIDNILKENSGDISYDSIAKMTYLDKVVAETLRKYPALGILNRECNKTYTIPDSDMVLEKGTPISISVVALQNDPTYFPNPERFDPERFSEEEKAKRHPYVYLPFGEGPRICIGMRLGLLQTKVGLTYILSKYSVHPTEKTKATLDYNPRSVLIVPEGGILLRLKKRF